MKDENTLEQVNEFYEFLQGILPEGITLGRGYAPKLTKKKAFTIIWYLQEHFRILPDSLEQCWNCGGIYDADCSGLYCGECGHRVPENYDNNKRQ